MKPSSHSFSRLAKHFYKNRSGFTFIELLVVVTIISILASILFPVFGRVRANARCTSSMSNIKQLSLAYQQYLQDYDEVMPGNATFPPVARFPYKLAEYVRTLDVFLCPELKGRLSMEPDMYFKPGTNDVISYVLSVFPHYGYNSDYLGRIVTATTPYTTYNTGRGPVLAQVQKPSETILLTSSAVDSGDGKFNGFYRIVPPSGSGGDWASSYVSPRFVGNTVVVAFLDGHVKAMPYDQLVVRDPDVPEVTTHPRYPTRFDTLWDTN